MWDEVEDKLSTIAPRPFAARRPWRLCRLNAGNHEPDRPTGPLPIQFAMTAAAGGRARLRLPEDRAHNGSAGVRYVLFHPLRILREPRA